MSGSRLAEPPDLADFVGSFGDRLRQAGVPTTPASCGRFAVALQLGQPQRVTELYWLARVTLVFDRLHVEAFDRTFNHVFGGMFDAFDTDRNPNVPSSLRPSSQPPPGLPKRRSNDIAEQLKSPGGSLSGATTSNDAAILEAEDGVLNATSAQERLRDQPFDTCTEQELAHLQMLLAHFRISPPQRRSYRTNIRRSGNELDLRATLQSARRTGGDPVHRIHRKPRKRMRRIVLLADVSGSMEPYARAYLYLLHGAVRTVGAEAFVFATGLHRLTKPLALAHPEHALRKAMAATPDWSGGTRIGEALRTFNDQHARRGLGRGSIVVIVSDGWESGDASLLAREVERLSRLAYKIIWVNPRKQHDSYRPLVGGMVAVMPWIDVLVSGHSVNALDEVIDAIRGQV